MPGLVGFIGAPGRHELLSKMAAALQHTSECRIETHEEKEWGIGRITLGILNPQPQPIWNREKTVCIFLAGELFDDGGWRHRLSRQGVHLSNAGDAELVLHLYQQLDDDFVHELNGAFIGAIWEKPTQKLLLFNDRLGLYPLYYQQRADCLIFATGLRALLADDNLLRRVDPLAIGQLLAFEYPLDDRTLLQDVKLMPPATLMTYENQRLSLHAYWCLEFQENSPPRAEDDYLDGFLHYMRQSTARQSTDVLPGGALLSGGLDSRIVLAMLAENRPANSFQTFTFGIPGAADTRLAAEVARAAGTNHHFHNLPSDYLKDFAQEGVTLTDGMSSAVHMHALANLREQAQLVRVLYKGYLGDALMGGHLHRGLWAAYDEDTFVKMLFDETCTVFTLSAQQNLLTDCVFGLVNGGLYDSFREAATMSQAQLVANRHNYFDLYQRQRRFILNGVQLVRSQTAVRLPFCDRDLIDFILTVPPGMRLDRLLVRRALAEHYPQLAKIPYAATGFPLIESARDIWVRLKHQWQWRVKIPGLRSLFAERHRSYANYDLWLRTVLSDWMQEILLSPQAQDRGYFRPDQVRQLVDAHLAGENHARRLGVLLSLELWFRTFLD